MITRSGTFVLLTGLGVAALPVAAQRVELELVSRVAFAPGDPADADVVHRFLSGDGLLLGVSAQATNLEAGIVDLNGAMDAYFFDLPAGGRRLISSRWDDPQRTSRGATTFGHASQDGRYVLVTSSGADILPPPATITSAQVVFLDLQTGERELISAKASDANTGSTGTPGAAMRISDDGRYLAFVSNGTDLVAGITIIGAPNIFFHDRQTGETRMVTLKSGSTSQSAAGVASLVGLSPDGRYVTFTSTATDQTPAADLNGTADSFQWDRDTGAVSLITRELGGNAAGGVVSAVTPNGRWAALTSSSSQLVAGYSGSNSQVYVWDRNTLTFSLVSGALGSPTAGANGASQALGLSDDGLVAVWRSTATNLVPGFVDNNGPANTDAFLANLQSGTRSLVSRKSGTTSQGANGQSGTVPMPLSSDGRYTFFWTRATDIDSAVVDSNTRQDLYRFDASTGDQLLISRAGSSATQTGAGHFLDQAPMASADASLAVFDMVAPSEVVSRQQLGLFQTATQTATLLSATPLKGAAGTSYWTPDPLLLSRDGRYVAWSTLRQAWLYDSRTESASRLSFKAGQPTVAAQNNNYPAAMSEDARYVLLESSGSDLVAGAVDLNETTDLVLLDRATQTTSFVSHLAGAPLQTLARGSEARAMSPDGRYTLFLSSADGVVAGVTGENASIPQVYLYDRQTDLSQLISRAAANASQVANFGAGAIAIMDPTGRHVVFQSHSTNLVAGYVDHNEAEADAFWLDRATGELILVSRQPGAGENGAAHSPKPVKVSNDGRWLIHNYAGMDLIPGGVGPEDPKALLFDKVTRAHTLVAAEPGSPLTACELTLPFGEEVASEAFDLSGDGRFVLFETYCQLVAGDSNLDLDVYVFDRVSQSHELISHVPGSPGQSKNVRARASQMSSDGRYVLYWLNQASAFRYDRSTHEEMLLSFSPLEGNQPVHGEAPRASADFRRIAFRSTASNIVPFDSGASLYDAFLATVAGLFDDGFESGDTSGWSAASP